MRRLRLGLVVYLSLLASAGLYHVVTGWLSLYDCGWTVTAVGAGVTVLGMLALLAKGNRSPLVRGQEGSLPRRPSWVDSVPTVVLGCVVGVATGYMMMTASIALGLRPARSQGVPRVLSMRAELPALWEQALAWQPDAYLDDATIYLGEDDRRLMTAHFKSPSARQQSLSVHVNPDRLIEAVPIQWSNEVSQEEPILERDWALDSRAALEAFARNDEIRFCLNSSARHGDRLILERLWLGEDSPVVWTLILDACSGAGGTKHHVEAASGKFVEPEPLFWLETREGSGSPAAE